MWGITVFRLICLADVFLYMNKVEKPRKISNIFEIMKLSGLISYAKIQA